MTDYKGLTEGAFTGAYRRRNSIKKIFGIFWLFLQLPVKDACKGWSYVWPFIKNEIEIMSLRWQLNKMDETLRDLLKEINELKYEKYLQDLEDHDGTPESDYREGDAGDSGAESPLGERD